MAHLVSLLKPSRRKPRLAAPVARLHHVAAAQDLGPGARILFDAQVHGIELAGACTGESAALCGAMVRSQAAEDLHSRCGSIAWELALPTVCDQMHAASKH